MKWMNEIYKIEELFSITCQKLNINQKNNRLIMIVRNNSILTPLYFTKDAAIMGS